MFKLAYPIGAPEITDSFMGFYGGDFGDNLSFISEAGYDAVELFLCSVESIPSDFKEMLSARGLKVACIGTTFPGKYEGLYLSAQDDGIRKAAVDRLKSFVTLASEIGCRRISIGKMRGSSSENPNAMNNLVSSVRELCSFAGDIGVEFMIEPQNRKQLDYINTVEEGYEFVRKVGMDNIFLHLDTFHMAITEKSPAESIRRYSEYVRFYHVAGPERMIPGSSDTTFIDMIREIASSGYDKDQYNYLSPEIKQVPDCRIACNSFIDFMRKAEVV